LFPFIFGKNRILKVKL